MTKPSKPDDLKPVSKSVRMAGRHWGRLAEVAKRVSEERGRRVKPLTLASEILASGIEAMLKPAA